MTRKAYCIFDVVAQDVVGGMIMLVAGEAVAVRNFADAVLAPQSHLARHPDDFLLVHLGDLDTPNAGSLPMLVINDSRIIMSAASILAAQQREGQPNG